MNKACSVCGVEQDIAEFAKSTYTKSGVSNSCKKCDRERARAYYTKNKAKVCARTNKYRKANLDKHRGYAKKHYKSHRPAYRQKEMAYQLKRRKQTPSWLSKADIAEMEGVYLFCQIFKGFQVDHIVPIRGKTVSGLHAPWNLQVLPRKENARKRNTLNPSLYPQQGQCAYLEIL